MVTVVHRLVSGRTMHMLDAFIGSWTRLSIEGTLRLRVGESASRRPLLNVRRAPGPPPNHSLSNTHADSVYTYRVCHWVGGSWAGGRKRAEAGGSG